MDFINTVFRKRCVYHCGSLMPTPLSSVPAGSWPLSARVTLHGVTRAAMDRTLQRGPVVAAMSGTAVDANHHFLSDIPCQFPVGQDALH